MGQYDFEQIDHRASGYVQDKWQVNNRLTLNLGVRYDWQDLTENTKDAIGPRVGVAYDLTGDGKTRGPRRLRQGLSVSAARRPADAAATVGDRADARLRHDPGGVAGDHGHVPGGAHVRTRRRASTRLRARRAGVAIISPACRAFLNTLRGRSLAGGVVNNTTTGPLVDGDRRMAYTWAFSAGVKRELMPNMAVSIDYVGNRGKRQHRHRSTSTKDPSIRRPAG